MTEGCTEARTEGLHAVQVSTRARESERNGEDERDDLELVAGLRAGAAWAPAMLVARHGPRVRRVLLRLLGRQDDELSDLFQEVMTAAWKSIAQLEDPAALLAWLTRITVFTARTRLRARQRRRWLSFLGELPEVAAPWASPELREAAQAVYDIFDRMPLDERIPFALHVLDGLELEATASACGMSVATVRRRLTRGERRFHKLARAYEVLVPWLEDRSR
jgi:RNA polymerase sigma-70 factor, ECF subfamily